MAKKKPSENKASICPVTDEACKKDCAKESCSMDILENAQSGFDPAKPGSDKTVEFEIKSSPKGSDLENHPKFAKFKTGGKPL